MKVLITGAAGFIGSNFTNYLIKKGYKKIFCIDKLGYASKIEYLKNLPIEFEKLDLLNTNKLNLLIKSINPDYLIHFAAESHVDNSIKNSIPFIQNNIIGTVNLLESVKNSKIKKFIYISTDEVFGTILKGKFNVNSLYSPLNPYSASKASGEHFVKSYLNTFNIPSIITNCSNNYGPRQHKEKLIPKVILNAINNQNIPVFGKGLQIRDWIYVEDHCEALEIIMKKGLVGKRYLIGSDFQITNLNLIKKILKKLKRSNDLISFVKDRQGHDFRYAIDNSALKKEFKWEPKFTFDKGINETIKWYEDNQNLF